MNYAPYTTEHRTVGRVPLSDTSLLDVYLINSVGVICPTISAMYFSKAAMDIVTEQCQPHPGVLVIYELA